MKQLVRRLLSATTVLVILGACTSKGSDAGARGDAMSIAAPRAAARDVAMPTSLASAGVAGEAKMETNTSVPAFDPTAMIIRTGTASVEVTQLDSAVAEARRAAARVGGAVANAQVATGRNEVHSAVLQIKVPAAQFDSLLTGIAPLGRVESVQVTAQDVGEEYVDIQARLTNLRRLESRLIDLLANRTGKLSDVLTVEHELARVRGEIEQIEGRRRFLERSTAVSSLQLTLHEPTPIIAGNPGTNPIASAFRDAWRSMVATIAWFIAALGFLIPTAVVVTGGTLLILWVRRRLQPARTAQLPAA
jgi:hypothetical protein